MSSPARFRPLRPDSLLVRLARNSSSSSSSLVTPILIRYNRYATQSSLGSSKNGQSPRKSITVTSDDGAVKWGQLSRAEKAARATQQSVNFLVILAGAAMTVSMDGDYCSYLSCLIRRGYEKYILIGVSIAVRSFHVSIPRRICA